MNPHEARHPSLTSGHVAAMTALIALVAACGPADERDDKDTSGDAAADVSTTEADGIVVTDVACTTTVDCAFIKTPVCREARCGNSGRCVITVIDDGVACNDGDPCTTNDKCKAGTCTPQAVNECACSTDGDCSQFDDGNVCNGVIICDKAKGKCAIKAGTVVTCPAPNEVPCATSVCDPKDGLCKLTPRDEGAPCLDGNPCSIGETCIKGTCTAKVGQVADSCQCAQTADCAALEDGNLCNGTLFCQRDVFPYKCQVNPAKVVSCSDAADTACIKNKCATDTGLCGLVKHNENGVCNDGNACTADDTCVDGLCVAKGPNTCPCVTDKDCAAKEDGNACNGLLYCNKQTKSCEVNKATVVQCPSGGDTTCLVNACAAKDGVCAMKPVKDGTACFDGNACTPDDTCQAGVCKGGTNTCACSKHADCATKEDGNLCNGTLFCDKAKGTCRVNKATIKLCPTVLDTAC